VREAELNRLASLRSLYRMAQRDNSGRASTLLII
jgi:hypothetical protein